MALAPGTRLGPYEISDQIGEGGMGVVYRGTDTTLKRAVAIKVLPDALASDGERLARFQREAEVLASLNHANIAHVYGLEQSSGATAIVMELVDGPTLEDRILQGPLPVKEAMAIAAQIADALDAAHRQSIVHRDLKPANIKLRPPATVKVLDFGLAKGFERVSRRGRKFAHDQQSRQDGCGRDPRHARVHGPRAGEGRSRRQAGGHLGLWRDPLRDAHRESALPPAQHRRDDGRGSSHGA